MRKTLDDMLPRFVLDDRRLNRTNKLVYMYLRSHPKNTIARNAVLFAIPYETLRSSVRRLIDLDWAYEFSHPISGRSVIVPWMPMDVERLVTREIEQIGDSVSDWGEWTMKAMLDVIVDDTKYRDNTRPKWALLGEGNARFELDRLYRRAKVAIEFQGRQHYEEVHFPDGKSDLQGQRIRDGIKALACMRQRITFVEIPATELSYETLVAKLDGLLPLLPPRRERPLFRSLINMCHKHVNYARQRMGN